MNYFRPLTLAEALAIRAGEDVTVLAGGTDIYPAAAGRRAWGDPTHKDILDVSDLKDLRGIAREGGFWRIGATTTWTDILRAELPPAFDGLKRAAREVGGQQIQNRGTIAGNLVTASPAGDGIPNLLVLDTEVELSSRRGIRRLDLADFLTGYRKTALEPDEIVTAILVPAIEARSSFLKLGARRYLVISIVMVAGLVELDGERRITAARIAVGACSPVALRLTSLEAELVGSAIGEAAAGVGADHLGRLAPLDDIRGSAAYRQEAARCLVADCLRDLTEPASTRAA